MDILRIVLIVVGVIVLVGIYLADRWKRSRARTRHEEWSETPVSETDDELLEPFYTGKDALPDEWVGKAVTITPRRHEQLTDECLDGLKGLDVRTDSDSAVDTATDKPLIDEAPTAEAPIDVVATDEAAAVTDNAGEVLPEDVIILTVMAGDDKRFGGPLLLRALQELGIEHGEMDIFHYHVSGRDIPLFSVANILEPGSFNLDEIAALETPGLAIFMRLPAVLDGEPALTVMLQKSRQIAARLSGTLCDERRRPLDETSLAALQARVLPYIANV